MGTVTEKLQAVLNSKNAIRDKFSLAEDLPFSQYADNIQAGGSGSETELYYYSDVEHIENELHYDTNILVVSGFPTDVDLICGPIDINGEYTLVDNEATGYDRKWLNAEKGVYIADSMESGTWNFECENNSVVGRLYPSPYNGSLPIFDTPQPFLNLTTSFEWILMGTDIEGSVLPFSYTKTYNKYTANKIHKKQNGKFYISASDEYFNWETKKPFVGKFYNRDITVQSDYVYGPEPVLMMGAVPLQLENPFAIDTDRVWSITFKWTNAATGQVEDEWYYKVAFSAENQRWEHSCDGDILCFTTDLENWPDDIRYIEYYDGDRAVNVNDELINGVKSVNIADILDTTGTVIPVTINIEDDVHSFVYEVVAADDSVVEFEQVNKTNTGVTLNFTSGSTTFIPPYNLDGSHDIARIYLYDYEKHKVCIGVISLGVSYEILKKRTINITSVPEISGTVGTALTAQVTGTVVDGSGTIIGTPTFTASGLPGGLTMDGSGLISGTPTTEASGTYTVTASYSGADDVTATGTFAITAAAEPEPTAGGNVVFAGFADTVLLMGMPYVLNGTWTGGSYDMDSGDFVEGAAVEGQARTYLSPNKDAYLVYYYGQWYVDPKGGVGMYGGFWGNPTGTTNPWNEDGTSLSWLHEGTTLTGTVLPEGGSSGGGTSATYTVNISGFGNAAGFEALDGDYKDDGTGARYVKGDDIMGITAVIRWVNTSEALDFKPSVNSWCILDANESYAMVQLGGTEGDITSIACTGVSMSPIVDASQSVPVTITVTEA